MLWLQALKSGVWWTGKALGVSDDERVHLQESQPPLGEGYAWHAGISETRC